MGRAGNVVFRSVLTDLLQAPSPGGEGDLGLLGVDPAVEEDLGVGRGVSFTSSVDSLGALKTLGVLVLV